MGHNRPFGRQRLVTRQLDEICRALISCQLRPLTAGAISTPRPVFSLKWCPHFARNSIRTASKDDFIFEGSRAESSKQRQSSVLKYPNGVTTAETLDLFRFSYRSRTGILSNHRSSWCGRSGTCTHGAPIAHAPFVIRGDLMHQAISCHALRPNQPKRKKSIQLSRLPTRQFCQSTESAKRVLDWAARKAHSVSKIQPCSAINSRKNHTPRVLT